MIDDRHEARLLLAILRERWDEAEALCEVRPIDADAFCELARTCDVRPGLHALLKNPDRFQLVGDQARSKLEASWRKCQADNAVLLLSLERALDLLAAAGITPIALKGLDAIHRLGFRFDERTLDDVDLLVHPDQFERTMEALTAAGWQPPPEPKRTHWLRNSYQIPLTSPDPVPIYFEIHWGLGQEKRYAIDPDGLCARAVPLEVCGRPVLRLDDHDAVAHHLLHHVQHYFDRRLKWTLDLVRIIRLPGFDWSIVAGRLDEWGGRAAAGMALVHLRKLFPDWIPAEAPRLLPAAGWRRALTLPIRSGHPLDLFRGTRGRRTQLFLATVLLEEPSELPAYLFHRATRGGRPAPQ